MHGGHIRGSHALITDTKPRRFHAFISQSEKLLIGGKVGETGITTGIICVNKRTVVVLIIERWKSALN